jgi:hypothetical protein
MVRTRDASPDQLKERPRYREAYPRLDIMRAAGSFDAGQPICEFTDGLGQRHGIARFDRRGDLCQIEYHFHFPQTALASDWIELQLAPVDNGFTRRVTILCPVCGSSRKILYFKDAWTCASCAELLARIQLIHPDARKWEKLDKLSRGMESGKPHGMHSSTYTRLISEIQAIEKSLYGHSRVYASNKYSDIVKSSWRARVDSDELLFPTLAMPAPSPAPSEPYAPIGVRADVPPATLGDYEVDDRSDL